MEITPWGYPRACGRRGDVVDGEVASVMHVHRRTIRNRDTLVLRNFESQSDVPAETEAGAFRFQIAVGSRDRTDRESQPRVELFHGKLRPHHVKTSSGLQTIAEPYRKTGI